MAKPKPNNPASERVKRRLADNTAAGGRTLYVVLRPEANAALSALVAEHGTITRAVESALLLASRAKPVEVRHA